MAEIADMFVTYKAIGLNVYVPLEHMQAVQDLLKQQEVAKHCILTMKFESNVTDKERKIAVV